MARYNYDKARRSGVYDLMIYYPSLSLSFVIAFSFFLGIAVERREWFTASLIGLLVYYIANGLTIMAYSGGREHSSKEDPQ